ncbi:hypothetical protein PG989_002680 [Apiospora arundinis]
MQSQHSRVTGSPDVPGQELQKNKDTLRGGPEEAIQDMTQHAPSLTQQGAQAESNQPVIDRPHPLRGPLNNPFTPSTSAVTPSPQSEAFPIDLIKIHRERRNAISGPSIQPRPEEPTRSAQEQNSNSNEANIDGHPNPLRSNPVIMTKDLAQLLARHNSAPSPASSPN